MNAKKGFTLIELLVVIAIIGILAAMVMVALGGARAKARDANRKSDLRQIKAALELYYADNEGYPIGATWVILTGALTPATGDVYMKEVPVDPKNTGLFVYAYNSTAGDDYTLTANMENGNDPDDATPNGAAGGYVVEND